MGTDLRAKISSLCETDGKSERGREREKKRRRENKFSADKCAERNRQNDEFLQEKKKERTKVHRPD